MEQLSILILTDHKNHSTLESTYPIARAMASDPRVERVEAASRTEARNQAFFENPSPDQIHVVGVDDSFTVENKDLAFTGGLHKRTLNDYDYVWLRMPRANSIRFFEQIGKVFPPERIINQPDAIISTGNKRHLLNFSAFCPPIRLCHSIEEVKEFAQQFAIVLKPQNSSGGKGIVRIEGDKVYAEDKEFSFNEYLPILDGIVGEGYLAMKFLKNVTMGDKRIIVCNGEVVGSALRLPAEGSWLCNVSQGATSRIVEPDENEERMAREIGGKLLEEGIVLFGFDTLVDDDGKRVLSELNTSCVNGIYPIQLESGKPVVREVATLLVNRMHSNIKA